METERKGCIKLSRGDWIVRRKRKGGVISTSTRRPSDREREANQLREQNRRRVTRKIYSGLLKHGNFHLPKHPDRNDILIALCEEAGYKVSEDGTLSLKQLIPIGEPSKQNSFNKGSLSFNSEIEMQPEMEKEEEEEEELSLDLTISYKYM